MISRRDLLRGPVMLAGLRAMGASAAEPRRLAIPELIDARRHGNAFALSAQDGRTAFFGGEPTATRGFNGGFLGPTIRLHRGDTVTAAVTNKLSESTTVHWHGLLVPSEADGGPHQLIAPGATWRPKLRVDQPAATLWYHAHPHPRTRHQIYSGLAGMLIVADDGDRALGLPAEYGVDDLPLILRDAAFDGDQLVYPAHPMTMMHGVRGLTMLANGTPNAQARVPAQLVRLRLANAANARVFDLDFDDGRSFHWIGSDGGLLERAVTLRSLRLAPGQRAEILVDFSDGGAAVLQTAADPTATMGMMRGRGGGGGMMVGMGDPLAGTAPVVRFEPTGRAARPATIPGRLSRDPRLDPAKAVRRRSMTLTMGMMGGMMGRGMRGGMGRGMGMAGRFGIDGRAFDMRRIDQIVRLGDTEVWEVSGETMPHPFHLHGVHFEVLKRAGRAPDVRDQGRQDTVLVEEPVELMVRFEHPAAKLPYMFHCHTLEHEDGGMMGQYLTRA